MKAKNRLKVGGLMKSVGSLAPIFTILIIVSLFFFADGYPTLNDIYGILSVASIDSPRKWLNGFYGPGYTGLTSILGVNVFAFGTTYVTLFCVFILWGSITLLQHGIRNPSSTVCLFCFACLGLFLTVGLNYSDGIFLSFVLLGLLSLYRYFWCTQRQQQLILSGLFFCVSLLFRHHGLVFVILVLPALWLMNVGFSAFRNRMFYGMMALILLPNVAIWISLDLAGLAANWQTFNAYQFVFPVNWYEITPLLESGALDSFNFDFSIHFAKMVQIAIERNLLLFSVVALFSLAIISFEERSNQIACIVALVLIALYMGAILPSLGRGLYPIYGAILFVTLNIAIRRQTEVPLLGFVLSTVFLLGLGANGALTLRNVLANRLPEAERILRTLKSREIALENVFIDDFNLYLPDNDFMEVDTFGGWSNLHPDLRRNPDNYIFEGTGSEYSALVLAEDGYVSQNPTYLTHIKRLATERVKIGKYQLFFF